MNNTPKAAETAKPTIPEWVRNTPGVTDEMFDRGRYEPSGGWEWFAHYTENLLPVIDEAIANARRYLGEAAQRDCVIATLRKQISASKSAITEVERLAKTANMSVTTLAASYHMWVRATLELETRLAAQEEEAAIAEDVKAAKSDISALTAFKEYILLDSGIDIALHALHLIDTRYRMRLFRSILKQMKHLETQISVIRASRSRIFALLNENTCIGVRFYFVEQMDHI